MTWLSRVLDLLNDPVGQAILRRDGLSRDDVLSVIAPVAEQLRRRPSPIQAMRNRQPPHGGGFPSLQQ
uniref:Uncharacterized protein n=2 Tax=Azospirillum thermophilum TaxID=2202148 RepID=A0A2S2CNR5_9PROT|nr:hypothetical protein DEW08_06595 [Azospirillum thermophilum]